METEQPEYVEITKYIRNNWELLSSNVAKCYEGGLIGDTEWSNVQAKMGDIKWTYDVHEPGMIMGIESDATVWVGTLNEVKYEENVSVLEMKLWQNGTKKIDVFMGVKGSELVSGLITTTIRADNGDMGFREWEYSLNK